MIVTFIYIKYINLKKFIKQIQHKYKNQNTLIRITPYIVHRLTTADSKEFFFVTISVEFVHY